MAKDVSSKIAEIKVARERSQFMNMHGTQLTYFGNIL